MTCASDSLGAAHLRIRRLDAREPEFLSTLDALLAFESEADERIDTAVTEILRAVRTTVYLSSAWKNITSSLISTSMND